MPNDNNQAPVTEVGLRSLKLRPGVALQTQGVAPGSPKKEAQFLAAIEGKGVMVGPHAASSGKASPLKAGEEYTVQGFTGQHDFSFKAQVIQIFEVPFVYALLVYPKVVQARLVRRSLRMKTSLPAKLSLAGGSGAINATLIDVSPFGAMVHAPSPVGVIGDVVNLAVGVNFEGELVGLEIPAKLCHSHKAEAGDGVHVGMSFKTVSQRDRLILHYLAQSSTEAV
ncbi:PilZ domain-containing protein [Aquabacterium sp.]|uniref:PilZ domain-containing protein n=1 Tax=Aquabacterium sp. TaxID=1872578 RepID=UPI002489F6B0|nr:PilZ domain-containing protein [Aquabacterium sp.]MDI1257792.1 PilZ domain-containing protein [Aquabacterium sp.]